MPLLILLCCLRAASCGGGGNAPTTPSSPPNPHTFTLPASGVSPKELIVSPGTQVLFVNNDSRRHDMTSDPHPDHLDCPELNAVGVLNQGASRPTLNLSTIRTCGFHDHDNPPPTTQAGNMWTGRIVVR